MKKIFRFLIFLFLFVLIGGSIWSAIETKEQEEAVFVSKLPASTTASDYSNSTDSDREGKDTELPLDFFD